MGIAISGRIMLYEEMTFDRETLFGPARNMKPQTLSASVKAVHKPNITTKVMDFSFMMSDSFRQFPISPAVFRVVSTSFMYKGDKP